MNLKHQHDYQRLKCEVARLRRDCAEAYQVVGALALGETQLYSESDIAAALDNLSAAAAGRKRPHENLLPWPKPLPHNT